MVYRAKKNGNRQVGKKRRKKRFSRLLVGLLSFLRKPVKFLPHTGSRGGVGATAGRSRKNHFFFPKKLVLGLTVILLFFLGIGYVLGHADIFRVTDLQISGTHVLTERQLFDLTGLRQGVNLFRFDTGNAEHEIRKHPWVKGARIKKQWPSSLVVEVQEYQPFALINLEKDGVKKLYYIAFNGHIIHEVPEGGTLDLPIINGANAKEFVDNEAVGGSDEAGAMQILHLAAQGNAILPLQSVSEVRIDKRRGLVLYLTAHPFPIYFGRSHFLQKYGKLLIVLKDLYNNREIDKVDSLEMDYSNSLNKMLCRWVQP